MFDLIKLFEDYKSTKIDTTAVPSDLKRKSSNTPHIYKDNGNREKKSNKKYKRRKTKKRKKLKITTNHNKRKRTTTHDSNLEKKKNCYVNLALKI